MLSLQPIIYKNAEYGTSVNLVINDTGAAQTLRINKDEASGLTIPLLRVKHTSPMGQAKDERTQWISHVQDAF